LSNKMTDLQFIKGEQLYLSPFTLECITDEYIGWLNNRHLMRYSRQSMFEHSHETCLKHLESFAGSDNSFFSVRTLDNVQIGTVTTYVKKDKGVGDIGILVAHPSAKGKDFAYQAWGLAMAYLFDGILLDKATGGTVAEHQRMISIFERWGMKHEETWTGHQELGGKIHDAVRYGISRAEWMALPNKPVCSIDISKAVDSLEGLDKWVK